MLVGERGRVQEFVGDGAQVGPRRGGFRLDGFGLERMAAQGGGTALCKFKGGGDGGQVGASAYCRG